MRPAGCEAEVIRALASMPFLDRTEMVAVTGRSKGAVYEAVERLEQGGFCTAVPHAAPFFPQTQRYHLAAAGLHWLAGEEGKSLDDLMLERPVSAQWRRNLMERLDALASIYRLAAGLAALEYPIRFRWYRALPLDAAVELPGGRSVGIVRRGNTADRSPFSNRMWRLRGRPLPRSRARPHAGPRAAAPLAEDAGRLPRAGLPRRRGRGGRGHAGRPGMNSRPRQRRRRPALPPRQPGRGRRDSRGRRVPAGLRPRRLQRRGPGMGHPRLHAAFHHQGPREARRRAGLRLALAHPHGPGRADGGLPPYRFPGLLYR